jgi:hypothetical protein
MTGDRALSAETAWCGELRDRALDFLESNGVMGATIAHVPDWHLFPLFCIWAVHGGRAPDQVIFWVVCGDLPSDMVPAVLIGNPRDAMRAVGARWLDAVPYLRQGMEHPSVRIEAKQDPALFVPYLERRACFLVSWADDDSCWGLECGYYTY